MHQPCKLSYSTMHVYKLAVAEAAAPMNRRHAPDVCQASRVNTAGCRLQINNGVYKSGFSTTQAAYDRAQQELYTALDTIDQRLSQHRFLVGNK